MGVIRGSFERTIFSSANNYIVGLFKVKENDITPNYNKKIITITGYFHDIEEDMELELIGEFVKHNKYGEQFNVTSYQNVLPTEKNSIVNFLSSELFKGIGEAKAESIYEKLGDEALDKIKKDKTVLNGISGLSSKNIESIVKKLEELEQSSEVLLKLSDLGFSVKDATLIYKNYQSETLKILDDNLYQVYFDLKKISFNKIDTIARKNNINKDDKKRVKAGIIYTMYLMAESRGDTYSNYDEIRNGLKIVINYEISESFFLECLNELVLELKIMEIYDYYQLMEYYEADSNIVKRLTYLNNKQDVTYKKGYLDSLIKDIEEKYQITYDDIQRDAIKNAFLKNFLIITGGPGTGKTTIIKSIVLLYQEIYKIGNIDLANQIALLAPTGRASKRIMESTEFPASTIHRFLKWNKDLDKFSVNEWNKSDVKLVIVDEVSMIDTLLLHNLLNGLKYDTKVIFVGDANQLPSVSPGQVLKDLIDTDLFPVIKLKKLYRQADESNIINLAHDINEGLNNYDVFNKNDDVLFYEANSNDLKEKLTLLCKDFKNENYNDFQIMAPMYKTMNGIDNLNKHMQELFNPKSKNKNEIMIGDTLYREGDKVLQLNNQPDDNIYNGDIGIILEINNLKKEITIDYDSNVVTFNKSNFLNFTLGYVISIHKSQGSEFQTVIIPLLKEYGRMLYKKLTYTGVTRTKKKLILLGEVEAYEKSILNNNNDHRKTNLCEKIKNRYV